MKRNNKKALYEKIMQKVSREVKRALNESFEEYYVWYSNWEDGETHDMSYEEIRSYQIGWMVAGPFNNIDDAIKAMKEKVRESVLESWYIFVDYWEEDYDPDDNEIFDFIKNRCDKLSISKDKKQVIFREHEDANTCEWNILTADEVERKEQLENGEISDDEDDDFWNN